MRGCEPHAARARLAQSGRMNEPIRTEGHAHAPATIRLGDLEVQHLGYGAMRLPGKEVWGEPDDPERARHVLRRAVELGVNFIDTAWYYGPFVSNRLIAEALHHIVEVVHDNGLASALAGAPRVAALADRVGVRPRIAHYVGSPSRFPAQIAPR